MATGLVDTSASLNDCAKALRYAIFGRNALQEVAPTFAAVAVPGSAPIVDGTVAYNFASPGLVQLRLAGPGGAELLALFGAYASANATTTVTTTAACTLHDGDAFASGARVTGEHAITGAGTWAIPIAMTASGLGSATIGATETLSAAPVGCSATTKVSALVTGGKLFPLPSPRPVDAGPLVAGCSGVAARLARRTGDVNGRGLLIDAGDTDLVWSIDL